MALSAVDHFLLAHGEAEQRRFMAQQANLQGRLADAEASNQGHIAILCAVIDAYERGEFNTVAEILGSYDRRKAIYKAAYDATYNALTYSLFHMGVAST
jgi:hypothetical protein